MPSRTHGFPGDADMPIWLFPDDTNLKAHPCYTPAKAGDVAAGVNLVSEIALPFLVENP
jgi:hypothetical protein